jgi:hypothetical protein
LNELVRKLKSNNYDDNYYKKNSNFRKGDFMKIIIFAGGWGSRMGQLAEVIPKPMVSIGNKPILWHIMKIYSH